MRSLLSLLYPAHCASCGSSLLGGREEANDHYLCVECRDGILSPPDHLCSMCSHPMLGMTTCINCDGRHWHLTAIVAACRYEGVGGELIKRFKYGRDTTLVPVLGSLLYAAMGDRRLVGKKFDAIVPVPLHPLREREREFNQSALLAARLGKHLGVPAVSPIRRIRDTAPQAGLDRSHRMENLEGAFISTQLRAGIRSILLVDDVTTTGATLDACASVLRKAGITEVTAVVVARG